MAFCSQFDSLAGFEASKLSIAGVIMKTLAQPINLRPFR